MGFTISRDTFTFDWIPFSEYGFWFPAFFFGVIVLVPHIPFNRFAIFRAIGLILLSFSAWWVAYFSFFFTHTTISAGIIGALTIVAGCRLIGPWEIAGKDLLKLVGLSGLGGLLFLLSFCGNLFGFIVWQYGVAFYLTRKIRNADDYFLILSPNQWKGFWLYIKRIRKRLFIFLFCILIIVFAYSYYFLFYLSNPDYRMLKYREIASEGQLIINDIYMFRYKNGLFPMKLEEIGERGLKAKGWVYNRDQYGQIYGWRLSYWYKIFSAGVKFTSYTNTCKGPVLSEPSGWNAYGQDCCKDVVINQNIPYREIVNTGDRVGHVKEVFFKRIQQYPKEPIHHQGLISFLIKEERWGDALTAAISMHNLKLQPWWEIQILPFIEAHLKSDGKWEKELIKEVESAHGFSQYYFLANFYQSIGRTDEAYDALKEGCQQPISPGQNDYFWEASVFAYINRKYDLAISICDAWEKCVNKEDFVDRSYLLIRAASLHELGKHAEAMNDLDNAFEINKKMGFWAGKPDRLLEAIEKGNDEDRWMPEDIPEYKLLIDYQ